MVNGTRITLPIMILTKEELQTLESIYEKYSTMCKSLNKCSDCPTDYIFEERYEPCLEKGCVLVSIQHILRYTKLYLGKQQE